MRGIYTKFKIVLILNYFGNKRSVLLVREKREFFKRRYDKREAQWRFDAPWKDHESPPGPPDALLQA